MSSTRKRTDVRLLPRFASVIVLLSLAICGYAQLPSLNFGNSGGASGCAPHTVTFSIGNVSGNSPATTYNLNFGDGSPPAVYTQATVPATVSHTYTTISCGQTFNTQNNSFGATMTATNAAGPTVGTVSPIQISKKPSAAFSLASSPICVGGQITFTNTSDPGVTYQAGNCNTNPRYFWTITGPSTGTVVSGSMGTDNGFPTNTNAWVTGTSPITLQFNTAGTYQMRLNIGNSCGIDDTTLNFCVVTPPNPGFNLSWLTGCIAPNLTVTATNTTAVTPSPCFTPTYSYNWSFSPPANVSFFAPGGPNTTNTALAFITSGIWDLTLTASVNGIAGCSAATTQTITVNAPPTANAGADQSVCVGGSPVQLTGTPAGGNWTGAGVNSSGLFTPGTIGNVTLTYTVGQAGCTGTDQVIISVINPTPANAGANQALCQNAPSINLGGTPAGGTWSGSPLVAAGGNFTPSTAGNYTLTYTFGSGTCAATDNLNITVHPSPSVSVNNPAVCAGSGATLTASGSGGLGPYSYGWSPATGLSAVTGSSVTATPAGSTQYTVTATDANSCPATAISTVTVDPIPVVDAGSDVSVCNSPTPYNLNGFSPTGGTWSGTGVSAGVFTSPGVGNYTLTYSVTQSGCTGSDQVVVSVINPTAANAGADRNACENGADISLSATPAGGNWSGSPNVTSSGVFTPSAIGSFTVTYTFGSGTCETSDDLTVTVYAPPTVSVNDVFICPGSGGVLTAIGAGGLAPYTYSWSPATNLSATTGASVTATPAANAQYTVTTTDAHSCTASAVSSVTINSSPQVIAGADLSICNTPNPVQLAGFSPAGGTWSGTGVNASGLFLSPGAGNFSLTYSWSDGSGCSGTDDLTITVIDPQAVNAGTDRERCIGAPSFSLTGQSPAGGTWTGSAVVTSNGLVTPSTAGTYTLYYSIGSGNCAVSDSIILTVHALPVVSAGPDTSSCVSTAPFAFTSQSPTSGGTWLWSGTGITDATAGIFTPGADAGTFPVTYTFTESSSGCANSDQLTVTVNAAPVISVAPFDPNICLSEIRTPFSANPTGGTWFGPGLLFDEDYVSPTDSAWFVPPAAGVYQINYAYTDQNQCTTTAIISLIVIAPAPVLAGPDLSFCLDPTAALVFLNGTPADGNWLSPSNPSWLQSNGSFIPNLADTAEVIFSHGSGSCLSRDTALIVIFPKPAIDAGVDTFRCSGDPCFQLAASPTGGIWSGTGLTDTQGTFCAPTSGEGTFTLNYDIDTTFTYQSLSSTCVNTDAIFVQVVPLPVPGLSIDPVICINTDYVLENTSSGPSGSFEWTVVNTTTNDTVFSSTEEEPVLNMAGPGSYRLLLNSISPFGCAVDTYSDFTVVAPPSPLFSIADDLVCGPYTGSITNQSTGYQIAYSWNFGPLFPTSNAVVPVLPEFPSPVLSDSLYFVELSLSNLCGTRVYKDSVSLRPVPVASIGTDYSIGCAPMEVVLQNISYGSPQTFSWDFGNGTTSSDSLPANLVLDVVNSPQSFTLSLEVTNTCGTSSDNAIVSVFPSGFTLSPIIPSTACAPFELSFQSSLPGQTLYLWDFGDGEGAVGDSVLHLYEQPGNYPVSLSVSNFCFADTVYGTVNLLAGPGLDFNISTETICENSAATINNTSTAGSAYEWLLGINSPAYSSPLTYLFPDEGEVSVGLAGTNASTGCADTLFKQLTVIPHPQINVTADPDTGCYPLTANFINTTFNSNSFEWLFSDGTTSTLPEPTVVIMNTGDFSALLIAHNYQTSQFDCPDTLEINLWVHPTPQSVFSLSSDSGCGTPAEVQTINASGAGLNYNWEWAGQTSSEESPIIVFADTGRYEVTLRVSNEFLCADTSTRNFSAFGQPNVAFSLLPETGCAPLTVNFTNLTLYGDSVRWGFGDGTFSNLDSTVHVYNEPGSYAVELYVSSGSGLCEDDTTATQAIRVFPVANASFTVTPTLIGQNDPSVSLTNQSSDFIDVEFYVDSTFLGTEFPSAYLFPDPDTGNASFTLIVNNEFNCPDTLTRNILIKPSPNVYIPEAFTPNGDGINDMLRISLDRIPLTYFVAIYDRWGHVVFQTEDYKEGWDGTFKNNGGTPIKTEVYVLKFTATFEDDIKINEPFKNITVVH